MGITQHACGTDIMALANLAAQEISAGNPQGESAPTQNNVRVFRRGAFERLSGYQNVDALKYRPS
jgi:hypothetical protein